MTNILLATAYLAPVQYYSKLNRADSVTIELFEHYIKQSYRNRCIIAGPEGAQPLTLPVEKAPNHGSIKDVRLSDHGNWRRLHWNALQSSYMTSPFFEYYADDFAPFYEKKYDFLCDFNEELMLLCCRLLDIDIEGKLRHTDTYRSDIADGEVDLRNAISPKCDFTADANFEAKPYYQVFRERTGFIPNLSIVDLLFNMGPEGLLYL